MKGRARALDILNVSRETAGRLDCLVDLLTRWNSRINLVSKSTLEDVWTRHILDSAQLLDLAPPGKRWLDLGSGGGFPGLIVAVLGEGKRHVTMVDSDQRKCTFLRTALREMGVAGSVICSRVAEVEPQNADILSARALASLDVLLGYAAMHLGPSGRALFPKGRTAEAEIEEALARWQFDCQKYPSKTDAESVVLSIGDISRV